MDKSFKREIRVATSNMMSLPRHDNNVQNVIDESTGPAIEFVGWQECGNDVYRDKVDSLKDYTTIFGGMSTSFASPISFRWRPWVLLRANTERLYHGIEGVSRTRHLESVHLKLKTDPSVHVAVINFHGPAVRPVSWLAGMKLRRQCRKVVNAEVARFVKAGIPIVITTDSNSTGKWFATVPFRRSQTVSNRIDHITFVNGASHRWIVKGKKLRETTSDHDTLLADVVLISK